MVACKRGTAVGKMGGGTRVGKIGGCGGGVGGGRETREGERGKTERSCCHERA